MNIGQVCTSRFPALAGASVCASLALLMSSPCLAQTSGGIFGTITDSSGALIPGASVVATNVATGIKYTSVTDAAGTYRIEQLPPASYTMQVTTTGFDTQDLQPFQLLLDQRSQQNFTLSVGKSTENISVSAASLLIETENSNQGQVIGTQQIQQLPLNGRDYLQLAELSAGVTPIVPGMNSPASSWTGTTTVSVAIAGLNEDNTSYLYDGIETRNAWYGAEGLLPSIDNIQEFDVVQSGAPAQYSHGGAFVNVVTRSGTNELHGSVFEFLRNNDFDARNYFDQGGPPPFHQNQFGARLGGPIKKDKMFFFVNYEGFRQIFPSDNFYNVPTAQQLAGDFSALGKPLIDPFTGLPFPGNQIPKGRFNATGQKILSYYPASNGNYTGGSNYLNVGTTNDGWDQESGRFDYTINTKDNVFARFTYQTQTTTENNITPSRQIIFPSNPKNLTVGWTHVFAPNLVNNVRYGWTHTQTGEQRGQGFNASLANPLGLIGEKDQPGSYGPPTFNVSGYANPGSSEGTNLIREGLNMATDQLSWQKGNQQITGGVDIRYEPIFMYEDWAATNIAFNGNYSGDSIADILLGVPTSSFTALGDPTLNLRMWYQSYFIQDNAKLSKKLSVNVGLNYEYQQQPVDTANHVGSFDIATGQSLSYPDTNKLGLSRAMVHSKYLNFAPRIGFNYVPFANGATDVKGGFGIYYTQPNINQYEVEVDTTKYYLIQSYNNSTQKVPGYPSTPANPGPPSFTVDQLYDSNVKGGGPTASFIQPNGETPYVYEWNLTIDHTIKNWLLEVAYLGSAQHHYEERPNIAPLDVYGGTQYNNPDGTPKIPGGTAFNGVQENTNSGSSFYDGVVFRVEHRYSNGFSVLGNYTFSKCLGYPWQDVFSWHPLNMRLDRGHCQLDLNQNLVANAIYELPFGQGKPFLNHGGIVDALVGGWRVADITSIRSGPWVTLGGTQNLGIFVNALPNVTGPVNNSSLHSGLGKHGRLGPYFNTQNVTNVIAPAGTPNAGATNAVGIQGNASVQSISTPGAATWDISGYKTFSYNERYTLDFRADVFNAFNRANFYGLDTGIADTRFGQVTAANPAREIQLSLRFSF